MNTHRMTQLSLYTACSLIIYIIEAALPPLTPIPGIKPGLANIITLLVMLRFSARDALVVMLLRVTLGSIFAGQAVSFLYSLSGGVLSLLFMALLNRFLHRRMIVLTSMTGALLHNIGQLLCAALLTRTMGVFLYLPWLTVSGLITGLFTGFCAHFINKALPRR